MSDPAVLYLESDDEVTSVVRRIRGADGDRIVLVTPGRSRATSSVVALRLLARAASDAGRRLAVVGDPLTRSLAGEAGIEAHATLDDARAGAPAAGVSEAPRHATISVARGRATEETAPTLAAASGADELTRPRPVAPPPPRPRTDRARARATARRAAPLVLLGAFGSVLLAAAVAAAALLPAATVTIAPRVSEIGPVSYEVEVPDAERDEGTVTARVEVVATGSYETVEPASGTVVLFNWTFVPVDVAAGTFVAAGEQAFATQADVTVPRGRLTSQGTIAAGEAEVAVVAAAAGPAANVPAGAIDTIVDPEVDARLRGFPENPQRRVTNPAPTSGGVDERGPEITEDDVATAVASLTERLEAAAADAAGTPAEDEIAVALPAGEPRIGVEGLAGTRDAEVAELSGELDWGIVRVDRAMVEAMAAEAFAADPVAHPDGAELDPASITVTLGEARLEGGRLVVEARVGGRATTILDPSEVVRRIRGRSAAEAEAALADLGSASVVLWPGWVTTVPELEWRVEVRITDPAGGSPE